MNGWTAERRARQAELIRTWKPWEKSTGAKTPEGKARVSQNAYKGNPRKQLMELTHLVNQKIRQAKEMVTSAAIDK